jgi:hypothetical protein
MAQVLRYLIILAVTMVAGEPTPGAAAEETAIVRADGWVRFACAMRPSVESDAHRIRSNDGSVSVDCGDGLVHLAVRYERGEVVRLEVRSGRPPREGSVATRDLGAIAPGDVVAFAQPLAARGTQAIAVAATAALGLADAATWPELLELARDRDRPAEVREAALFWLSVQAGDEVTAGMERIVADDDEELELREHAIFALSEIGGDETLATLRRIALENRHPQLRRTALFWLAQSDDPEVLELFERILLD